MYAQHSALRLLGHAWQARLSATLALTVLTAALPAAGQSIVQKLQGPSERIELTVNSSRILTLDQNIPRVQVNNPDVLAVTPLSKDQVQISAKRPGVTDVNLWGEDGQVYSVNVIVYGDVQELELALRTQYPNSSIKVHRYSNSLVLSGYVDRPDYVSSIARLAEDYAPKVINNITVGGVQQILLNVQVMEVSRTKLRALGFDFSHVNGGDVITSGVSGLVSALSPTAGTVTSAAGDTVRFGVVDNTSSFFGFLKALRQHDLMKILAEPKLTTVSGRPASFNSGGEFPVLVPQSLGTVSIEFKKFGTEVEFMPLVLANGNIRLEVKPRVSEIDSTRSVQVQNFTIPALRVREVNTAVEMKAGQTLALAGLIQNRVEAQNRGIPVLADLPFVGAAFRSVEHVNNEIELLILVRPEFVDALEPCEVPPGGPGLDSCPPDDHDLYWKGFMEVPCGTTCLPGPMLSQPLHGPVLHEPVPTPPANVELEVKSTLHSSPASSRRSASGKNRSGYRRDATAEREVRGVTIRPSEATPAETNTQRVRTARSAAPVPPGLIGPVGYDIVR